MFVKSLLNSADYLPNRVAGNPIELDHALIMLLLLVGLLSIGGKYKRYVPWVIVGGVILSLFTPTHIIKPAWPILSALILPILMWQLALQMATIRPTFSWRSLLAWLVTITLIGLALSLGAKLSLAYAALMGVLAASLMWQLRERATGSSDLGAFGQLTLALLLVEVDVVLHPLRPLLSSLLSGAAIGLFIGYLGVRFSSRLPAGKIRNFFYLGLVYLAYLVGTMMGISGVATAMMAGLLVASYSFSVGLWPTEETRPAPLNHWGLFALLAGIWLLLGWQAHVPITVAHVSGIGLGLVAAAAGVLVARWLDPMPEDSVQPLPQALLRKQGKVFLLLLGVLLLWPQEAVLTIVPLAVALFAALVGILILRLVIFEILDLVGVKLRWPD